ncbi:hypothetical protein D7Y05_08245 [bacterium 1XD42-54]|nr:hypothetical protein D7Y05_08245 [bacterium 1XD42-54]
MKKKIKAENADQLLEIIRAVQNGEEPEEALQRREAESTPEADSPKPHSGQKDRKPRTRREPKADAEKTRAKKRAGLDSEEEIEEPLETRKKRLDESAEQVAEKDADGQKGHVRKENTDKRTGRKLETVQKVLGEGAHRMSELLSGLRKKKEEKPKQEQKKRKLKTGVKKTASPEHMSSESFETDDSVSEKQKKTSDEQVLDRLLGRGRSGISSGERDRAGLEEDLEKKPETKATREQSGGRVSSFMKDLEQRGISRRELFMLGTGLIFVVLMVLLVINGIRSFLEEKRKSEHVTAESGLVVTVESEPQTWSNSYPIVLSVRAKGTSVSSVLIGGEEYIPDEKGQITVETSDYLLEAEVTTEKGVLTAQIEVPMLDAQAPSVNVTREDALIKVMAADARSGVSGVFYASVKDNDYFRIPIYHKYSEPVQFEPHTTYYFYAQDEAGNRSTILETTTEAAHELTLQTNRLSCFPGETRYLPYQESPAGALLNNLRFESANPEVAVVDGAGAVTAVGEGTTVITVSADGVASASCTVEVSNERTVTISAIGDCTLGTDENFNTTTSFNAFDTVNGHAYFFRNVKEVLDNDDVTFANMEGTLTTETTREAKQYAFKGDPSYTEILKSGSVEVVTLANNHSSDYGAKSLSDTKRYLTEAGIDYCIGDEIVLREINGIQTAFIGIYVLNDGMARENQVRETIASAKEGGAQLVIIAFHWGSEKATEPDDTQQALAHLAIDCGADLVVGHHPHVLQGIEYYNGKYIVYSLGNFCFGGNSSPSDTDTMIFRQTFRVGQDQVIADQNVEIIPCKISSVDGYNNYQPTVVDGTEADRIIGRVNKYSEAYGQHFQASDGLNGA